MPFNLGINYIIRNDIIENHTTSIANTLLGAEDHSVITIWDATYIYIEKSANYGFQKDTFSAHKKRSLLKFMIIVASDGYIIDFVGPYIGNGANNDASITQDIMEKNINDLDAFFEQNDIIVVDRGFRDSIDFLNEKGIEAKMPAFLKGISRSDKLII